MGALASRGGAAARRAEAAELLSQALGSAALLSAGDVAVYHGCLRAVLGRCAGLAPSTVAALLACFDLGGFCAAVLLPRGSAGDGRIVRRSPPMELHAREAPLQDISRSSDVGMKVCGVFQF